MAKKYMTKSIDRSVTVIIALEHERERQIKAIHRAIEINNIENTLWRINRLKCLTDLLNKRKASVSWFNIT